MNRVALALLGATALAFSSASEAAITVTSSANITLATPSSTLADSLSVGYSSSTLASPNFTGQISIVNNLSGLYMLSLTTSSAAVKFTQVLLNGPGGLVATLMKTFDNGFSQNFNLLSPIVLDPGTYTLDITGTNSGNGSLGGSVDISAVPEPGTWAFMLLGFGVMGFSVRRSRKQGLAQLA